jgi:siderophore synthetase component
MPVHPWQWQNKLLTVFAPDIARQFLIYLGEGEDQYLAQQSDSAPSLMPASPRTVT